jgi:hypothetical protein
MNIGNELQGTWKGGGLLSPVLDNTQAFTWTDGGIPRKPNSEQPVSKSFLLAISNEQTLLCPDHLAETFPQRETHGHLG